MSKAKAEHVSISLPVGGKAGCTGHGESGISPIWLAILLACVEVSKCVMGPIDVLPASTLVEMASMPHPRGETAPIPVIQISVSPIMYSVRAVRIAKKVKKPQPWQTKGSIDLAGGNRLSKGTMANRPD